MYKDGYISYNPDATNEAISASMNVENVCKSIESVNSITVPSSFKSSSLLASTLASIKTTVSSMNTLSSTLKQMQNAIEVYIGDDTLQELTTRMKGFNYVRLEDGSMGYLYIPDGYNSTKGLPMIVYMGGAYESNDAYKQKNKALGYIFNNGYNLDSVVFIPISKGPEWEHNGEITFNLIDSVANQYQVDKDRISLVGYSWGACTGYTMITNHPDYFSTFVPFGGYFRHIHNEEKMQTVANSSTKIIIYHSTRDDVYDRAVHIYNTLKQNGAQIVMYEFSGNCGHHNINEVFTAEMLDDLTNIRKGDVYSNLPEGIISIDVDEAKTMSLKYEMENGVDTENTYYVRLSPEKNETSQDILNVGEQNVPDLGATNDDEIYADEAPESTTEDDIKVDEHEPVIPPISEDTIDKNEGSEQNIEDNNRDEPSNSKDGVTANKQENGGGKLGVAKDRVTSAFAGQTTQNVGKKEEILQPESDNANNNVPENSEPTPQTKPTYTGNNKPIYSGNNTPTTVVDAPSKSVNILPSNRFSEVLPEMTGGTLGTMEISKSSVSYGISNVSEETYNSYIKSLQDAGYVLVNDKWCKNNYEIMIDYDGSDLNLSASIIE